MNLWYAPCQLHFIYMHFVFKMSNDDDDDDTAQQYTTTDSHISRYFTCQIHTSKIYIQT